MDMDAQGLVDNVATRRDGGSTLAALPEALVMHILQTWLGSSEFITLSRLDIAYCGQGTRKEYLEMLERYVSASGAPGPLTGATLAQFIAWVRQRQVTMGELVVTRGEPVLANCELAGLRVRTLKFDDSSLSGGDVRMRLAVAGPTVDRILVATQGSITTLHAFVSAVGKDEVLATLAQHAHNLRLERLLLQTEASKTSSLMPSSSLLTSLLEGSGKKLRSLRFANIRVGDLVVRAIARQCRLLEELELLPHLLSSGRPLLEVAQTNPLLTEVHLSLREGYLCCNRVTNDVAIKMAKMLPRLQHLQLEQTAVTRRALPQILRYRPTLLSICTDDFAVAKVTPVLTAGSGIPSSPMSRTASGTGFGPGTVSGVASGSSAGPPEEYEVNFRGCYQDMEFILQAFQAFDRIDFKHLDARLAVLAPILEGVNPPSKLTVLSLRWVEQSEVADMARFFRRFKHVQSLTLSGPQLEVLQVSDFAELLRELWDLQHLRLVQAPRLVTDSFLRGLLPLCSRSLRSLELFDSPDVTDESLLALAKMCPKLTSFCGIGCSFSLEGIKRLMVECPGWRIQKLEFRHALQWEVEHALKFDPALRSALGDSWSKWRLVFRLSGWY